MGNKASKLFEDVERAGGVPAKVRLASLARITSTEAASRPDDDELLSRLEAAAKTVRRELDGARDAGSTSSSPPPKHEPPSLRRQLKLLAELASQRALFLDDVTLAARRIDEATAHALEVERVSVWFLDAERTKITCADLFERTKSKHSAGVELFARDHRAYFEALGQERTIAVYDAVRDSRTSSFADGYLVPLGITSMLDVPLWVGDRMVGVLCHEHVGVRRTWTADDESFAYIVSVFVSLALERRSAMRASLPAI